MGPRGSRAYFLSDPNKGHLSCFGIALLPPCLVGRTPGKNSWPKCYALLKSKVVQGSSGSTKDQIAQERHMATTIGRENPWLWSRTLLESKFKFWSARSTRVQIVIHAIWLSIWWEEPLTKVLCIDWVKDHAGVSRGQPWIKLLRNASRQPNLVGRTPDQSVLHWLGSTTGQVKGHVGSTRGKIV